jgi:hypothetical protein
MSIQGFAQLISDTGTAKEYTVVVTYTVSTWGKNGTADASVLRFCVQLNDDSNTSLANQTVNTTPIGSTGSIFLTRVSIPYAYATSWKIQGYIRNERNRQAFCSIPGSSVTIIDPWIITPVTATCQSFTRTGSNISMDSLTNLLAHLPFYGTSYVYSLTPKVGYIYYPTFTPVDEPHNTPPWLNYTTDILNFWEKITGYATSGLVYHTPVTANININTQTNTITYTSNDAQTHPIGTLPVPNTDACYYYDPNPNSFEYQNVIITIPTNPSVNAEATSSRSGPIGFFFDNVMLFAAIAESGIDPEIIESVDYYETHAQEDGIVHRHAFSLMLSNFVIDSTLRVVGFLIDGFPIVAPFQAYFDGVYRPIETNDLDVCHGFASTISFTLEGVSLSYDYFYVCTLDFPYLTSAFRGTPYTPVW